MASSGSDIPAGKPADPYKAKNLEKDVSLEQKIEDLFRVVDSNKVGMMTSSRKSDGLLVSRAMAVAGKENGIDLVFITNTETKKTDELAQEPHVNVSFYNGLNGEWASISGSAMMTNDRAVVSTYYSPSIKAWLGDLGDGVHTGDENDPRIGIIKVRTISAIYQISDSTLISKAYEVAKGIITGNAPKVNILREVNETEVKTSRTLQ